MFKLLIGSNNKGKIHEIGSMLSALPLQTFGVSDTDIQTEPNENGTSYKENALIKARYYAKESGIPCIADDSGIVIEALENELGIHTRRWGAGAHASDEEWITYFLDRMSGEENKKAHFTCVIAFVDETGAEHLFYGECKGVITPTLEADYLPGLPISACFKPNGYNQVFSALPVEEKNLISHRGWATGELYRFLEKKFTENL